MNSLITRKINYAIQKKNVITDKLELPDGSSWTAIINAILNLKYIIKNYENENDSILNKLGLSDYRGDFVSPTSPVRQPKSMSGHRIWTDGDNYYYTDTSYNSYLINVENQEVTPVTFTDMPSSFDPIYVWTDGENAYYSYNNTQKVLDKQTRTWSDKTWTGLESLTYFQGADIWTDGDDIYFFGSLNQTAKKKKLNKTTGQWENVSFSGTTNVTYGQYIWKDGSNVYYSSGSTQKQLVSGEWIDVTWISDFDINGKDVFNIGEDVYTWNSNGIRIYKLDKETSTWELCDLGLPVRNVYAYSNHNPVWTDGVNYYLSWGTIQAKFDFDENKFVGFGWKDMSSLSAYNTKHIFSFKGDKYYFNNNLYIYNKSKKRFDSFLESFANEIDSIHYPNYNGVWTDGDNLYFSYGYSSSQFWNYVLDMEDKTWKLMDWSNSGLEYFKGEDVWHNGDDTYCDGYKLDKENKTWTMTYSVISSGTGKHIWTDGENLYYSYGSYQKVYNKNNDSWENKTWNISNLYGSRIWNLGDNVYYSLNDTQYMLDKETGNWVTKAWKDININTSNNTASVEDVGSYVWTDGDNYYYGLGYMFNDLNYLIDKILESVPRNSFNEYLKGEVTTVYEEDLKGMTTAPVFADNTTITTVIIPSNITTIPNNAFKNCTNITSITIPDSVTSIGQSAFEGCYRIVSLKLPNALTSITSDMFKNCSGLTNLVLPASIANVGVAFLNCNSLSNVYFKGTLAQWLGIDFSSYMSIYQNGVYFLDENGNVEYDGDKYSYLTSVEIPSNIVTIKKYCFFKWKSLTSVDMSNSSGADIKGSAFAGCNSLTSVTLPANLGLGGADYAFSGCTSLTSLNYLGTMSEWQNVVSSAHPYWKSESSLTTIHCTDGDITL